MLACVDFSLALQGASSEQLFAWQQLGGVGFVDGFDQHCVLSCKAKNRAKKWSYV